MDDVFTGVIGHAPVLAMLRAELGRPAQAYLFIGPAGVGKATVARRFAAGLLGVDAAERRRVLSGNHPDLVLIEPEGRASVTVDQARQAVAQASLAPMVSARKVFLLEEGGMMNDEAANALLETLEAHAVDRVPCRGRLRRRPPPDRSQQVPSGGVRASRRLGAGRRDGGRRARRRGGGALRQDRRRPTRAGARSGDHPRGWRVPSGVAVHPRTAHARAGRRLPARRGGRAGHPSPAGRGAPSPSRAARTRPGSGARSGRNEPSGAPPPPSTSAGWRSSPASTAMSPPPSSAPRCGTPISRRRR